MSTPEEYRAQLEAGLAEYDAKLRDLQEEMKRLRMTRSDLHNKLQKLKKYQKYQKYLAKQANGETDETVS